MRHIRHDDRGGQVACRTHRVSVLNWDWKLYVVASTRTDDRHYVATWRRTTDSNVPDETPRRRQEGEARLATQLCELLQRRLALLHLLHDTARVLLVHCEANEACHQPSVTTSPQPTRTGAHDGDSPSMTTVSHGSNLLPSASSRNSTRGGDTDSSKPSRRMVSINTASCDVCERHTINHVRRVGALLALLAPRHPNDGTLSSYAPAFRHALVPGTHGNGDRDR